MLPTRWAPQQLYIHKQPVTLLIIGQFRVLVVCIFLNRTRGEIAEPYIASFFEEYPTVESVRDADPRKILRHFFQPLGMHRRAWWVVDLARVFLEDPPMPMVLRCKTGEFDSHLSEVAHLPGVGEYASDAWRLFCREQFYASAGVRIAEQWRSLRPNDRILFRYV
jgi:methyl-CpG-binding domain protein 4